LLPRERKDIVGQVKRISKWSAAVLIIALAAIQMVPVNRMNPPVETEVAAPGEVRLILRRACYDCHSNETVWPWYGRVAPMSWLVAYDVRKGREELNFSTWNRLGTREQTEAVRESWEKVEENEMPPWLYRLPHPGARLSSHDRSVLRAWSSSVGGEDPH
jgi:hypothetical protein